MVDRAISSTCRTRQNVCDVAKDEVEGQQYLGNITIGESKKTEIESLWDSWKITLTANGIPVQFKIDTGADVTVVPEK